MSEIPFDVARLRHLVARLRALADPCTPAQLMAMAIAEEIEVMLGGELLPTVCQHTPPCPEADPTDPATWCPVCWKARLLAHHARVQRLFNGDV